MNPTGKNYHYSGPSQCELNREYRRRFLVRVNTRWHGDRSARR